MEFKPNIYPIMYWALAYGVLAGLLLFVVYLLSNFITVIWFPVFLTGVVFGGFRNWRKQKNEWGTNQGVPPQSKPVMQEFREAVSDITVASREMIAEQQAEDAQAAAQEQEFTQDEEPPQQQPPVQPPAPPAPPIQ